MEFSEEFFSRIVVFEGFSGKAYRCPAGVWTIGYGTTKGVREGMRVSREQAYKLLEDDARLLARKITSLAVPFTQNQFDAVGLFCYNIGFAAFKSSTLFNVIKKNRYDEKIESLWKQWKYSKGKVLKGLVVRREAECTLYFGR